MIKPYTFHFSVDDVFESLIEITDKKIPLKKHWFFKQLYKLWKIYKIRTGCHIFFKKYIKGKERYLTEVRSVKNEIKEGWLFFGPHALDIKNPPFKQNISEQKKSFEKIYKEINRFAGLRHRTEFLRLHHYSESFELSNYWKKKNIKALFSTDRMKGSHRMPLKISKQLLKFGRAKFQRTNFIRTDFRIEWLSKMNNMSDKKIENIFYNKLLNKKFIIIYTHEHNFKESKNITFSLKSSKILCEKLKLKNLRP